MSPNSKKVHLESEASHPIVGASRGGLAKDRRLIWLLAAVIWLAGSTFIALTQRPRLDPDSLRPAFSLAWWLYPIEENATRRLPLVLGEVTAIAASPDGKQIWAVGSDALILRSGDGGATWNRVDPNASAATSGQRQSAHFDLPGGTAYADAPAPPPQQAGSSEPQSDEGGVQQGPVQQADDGAAVQGTTNSSWVYTSLPRLPPIYLRSVWVGEREIWVSGDDGVLLRTTDSGRTWSIGQVTLSDSGETPTLRDLKLAPPKGCIVAGEGDGKVSMLRLDAAGSIPVVERLSVAEPIHLSPSDRGCWVVDSYGAKDLLAEASRSKTLTWPNASYGRWVDVSRAEDGSFWLLDARGRLFVLPPEQAVPVEAKPPTSEPARRVSAIDDRGAWVVGQSGSLWRTEDRGRSWVSSLTPSVGSARVLLPVPLPDGTVLTAMGGTLMASKDRGGGWFRLSRGLDDHVAAIRFFDLDRGIAAPVEYPGGLLRTEDGGRTWDASSDRLAGRVVSLGAIPPAFGWAVALGSDPLTTQDAGASWMSLGVSIDGLILDLEFADAQNGVLLTKVGSRQHLAITRDGGTTWRPLSSDDQSALLAEGAKELIHLNAAVTGPWVLTVASDRELYRIDIDAIGLSFALQSATRLAGRYSGFGFLEGEIWGSGPEGIEKGLGSQQPSPVSDEAVLAFDFLDTDLGFAVRAGDGAVIATSDGGQSWHEIAKYRIGLPPWYWLACLFSLVLLAPALAPPRSEVVSRSIAEIAISDRPLEVGDPDPLGFRDVALGLSRFLRNTGTRPPLTLAITGVWGAGKSSLMNLLRADLETYGFRPVWFNAWHHQKEEHLLAALLENVRQQAVPSWWRPEGLAFRCRLLQNRLRRWWFVAVVGALVAGLAVGWIARHPGKGQSALDRMAKILESLDPTQWGVAAEPLAFASETWALLLSLLAGALSLVQGLRAFGVKPAVLIAGLSQNASVRDIQAQTSFRYRFAREFRDVTWALQPRTLTVLIDDLDRCRPQNVLEVLEAVNFLVSSGDCNVIVGIDRLRVEHCVGYGFKEVAEEIVEEETTAGAGEPGRHRRAAFARQYLEKLINIEVPVPQAGEQDGRQLIQLRQDDSGGADRRLRRWLHRTANRWWSMPVVIGAMLVLGLLVGLRSASGPSMPPPPTVPIAGDAEPAPDEALAGSEASNAPSATTPAPAATRIVADALFRPGVSTDRSGRSLWIFWATFFAVIVAWVVSTLPEVEVRDSPAFAHALEAWFPMLYASRPTPRAIKRFLNRVRYYAMRQRAAEPPQPRLVRWLEGLQRLRGNTRSDGTAVQDGQTIPEGVLVALASLEHTHPEWLSMPEVWSEPIEFLGRIAKDLPQAEGDAVRRVIEEVAASGAGKVALDPYREKFQELSRGVKTI